MGHRTRVVIDLVVAIFFIVLFLTREGPDYTLHSVLGLVAIVPILVHLWPNRRWIKSAWSRQGWGRKVRLSRLNSVLAASTTVCTVTGVFAWAGVGAADVPHAVTGFLAIGVAIVHGFRNRDRFMALTRRVAV